MMAERFRAWAKERGVYFCPGCNSEHIIVFDGPRKVHDWNGDTENPTLSPSVILTWTGKIADGSPRRCCHSFVRDGRVEFLSDCTHSLAGQTVDLPSLPKDRPQ